jgi:hypothetical protein
MTRSITPRRLLLAGRNMAAGITLIITPALLWLGIAGPGQAAQAATITPYYFTLQTAQSSGTLGVFTSVTGLVGSTPGKLYSVVLKGPFESQEYFALFNLRNQEMTGPVQKQNLFLAAHSGSSNGPVVAEWKLRDAFESELAMSRSTDGPPETISVRFTTYGVTAVPVMRVPHQVTFPYRVALAS